MTDQQKQNQQKQQGQQNQQRADRGEEMSGEVSRSENLLPPGAADNTAESADGRFEVAEEVSLDQQSDATRRVGQAPKGSAAEALADSLKSGTSDKSSTS